MNCASFVCCYFQPQASGHFPSLTRQALKYNRFIVKLKNRMQLLAYQILDDNKHNSFGFPLSIFDAQVLSFVDFRAEAEI
jgi:hypothetical protein